MKHLFTLLLIFFTCQFMSAQGLWKDEMQSNIRLEANQIQYISASKSRVIRLDIPQFLAQIKQNKTIEIPLPDGKMATYRFVQTQTMEPGLASKYLNIKTFTGANTRDASDQIFFDVTEQGFHAIIHAGAQTIYIDPLATNQTALYMCYDKKDFILNKKTFPCEVGSDQSAATDNTPVASRAEADYCGKKTQLRSYRMAVATTGEYSAFHGNTKPLVLSAIVTTINRVNSVYERDLAVKLLLIDRNDTLIFLNPKTDPFSNTNSNKLIGESQKIISSYIGSSKYDIGHTMSTGGGGLADLGVICQNNFKASGITGLTAPIGDPYDIDYVAHEVGHQFGGSHTFNSSTGSCADNIDGKWAYETASGITIMAYAGICSPQDLAPHSIDNFHVGSLEQIIKYSREAQGNTCPVKDTITNYAPTVLAGSGGFTIPRNTPFKMFGAAKDADGDLIKYSWEQYDRGTQGNINAKDPKAPIFRCFSPTNDSVRVFPQWSDILSQKITYGEVLPDVERKLNFRVVARDYRNATNGGGGTCWGNYLIKVDAQGPFRVTYPAANTDTMYMDGYTTIKWDLAGSDLAPVNCKKVNIYMSIDGGKKFDILLAKETNNDGNEAVIIPIMPFSDAVRIKVEASDNIFFNISPVDCVIAKASKPALTIAAGPSFQQICLPKTAQIFIKTRAVGGSKNDTTQVALMNVLKPGFTFNFSKKTLIENDSTQLTIDFPKDKNDTLVAIVRLIKNRKDTIFNQMTIIGVSTDLSDVAMVSPKDETEGLTILPTFEWKKSKNATSYDFQLSADPSFKSTIVNIKDTTATTISLTNPLEETKVYYWHIKAKNVCKSIDYLPNNLFLTRVTNCLVYNSTLKSNISASGTPTVDNTIQVSDSLDVIAVSVPQITGTHESFDELQMSLVAPNGKIINLFKDQCLPISTSFNLHFDEGSKIPFQCPPNKFFTPLMPLDTLSKLAGVKSQGLWKLRIKDTQAQAGGALTAWQLKLCLPTQQKKPYLVKNIPFVLDQNTKKTVTNAYLEVKADGKTDEELQYIILKTPTEGFLQNNNLKIDVGSTFTQKNINDGVLNYTSVKKSLIDSVQFIVLDGKGGFLTKQWFKIYITVVGTNDLQTETLKFFPNPASKQISIVLPQAPTQKMEVTIYNITGQVVIKQAIDNQIIDIDIQNLANSLYFVKVKGENHTFTGRFIKE